MWLPMVLDPIISASMAFLAAILLLSLYSIMDIRNRRVPNRVLLTGGLIGIAIVILTGHLYSHLILHLSGISTMCLLSYFLFKTGAIGGADLKALVTISIISPGVEFSIWENVVFEGILAACIQILIMLILGYLYWVMNQRRNKLVDEVKTPPLIPMLLIGYILVQFLAFI